MTSDQLMRANAFAAERALVVGTLLGNGIHGAVFSVNSNAGIGHGAIKVHHPSPTATGYRRERDVYLRLSQAGVRSILGFNVPILLGFDDRRRIIHMTIVPRPFVLDFAGAFLDSLPDFSDEILNAWELEKLEQFGSDWPKVKAVMGEFEEYGVYLNDISPNNVAFGRRAD